MGHFNSNESITLVAMLEDFPNWMAVKLMILYINTLFSGGGFSSREQIE
ncbi:hypothetical protein PR003_g24204 [Phytophthora rubi]|uniref:Uncharacterized protein n=1 Tax=Phytophthora rubi TaxID=129364 RepID=A0A6A3IP40_9STRA|nr:hypothetical protein PR002_g23160 [Phytophthora rubi]KAE8985705.1 hypothetical protein PR001_g22814 [Phytophthora rubi]KAE9294660.1 hypothetical protein PR003_g24204 [Phytophthora rubi]